jgi:hypothetical protein
LVWVNVSQGFGWVNLCAQPVRRFSVPVQFHFVGVVEHPVEDGVRHARVVEHVMQVRDGQLAEGDVARHVPGVDILIFLSHR